MRRILTGIYYFLPIQLLLLHFRRYQLLLVFWGILLLTITGNFAAHFGASSLFLAPEYQGVISYASMFLLGSAFGVFMMMWHITTFIIHSKRISHIASTRHAFLLYALNNAIIPLAFLIFYSVVSVRFQLREEHYTIKDIVLMQVGFYVGFLAILLLSFAYFFRVSRDYFKSTFARFAKPAYTLKSAIPRDGLDEDSDEIHARSHLSLRLRIIAGDGKRKVQPRIAGLVLQRHHRNVVFATFVAYVVLLILGMYIDNPWLRIPAGAGFLLLFAIMLGLVGAFKYFMRSWETLGWISFIVLLSVMVKYKVFDLRSIAYGLDYH